VRQVTELRCARSWYRPLHLPILLLLASRQQIKLHVPVGADVLPLPSLTILFQRCDNNALVLRYLSILSSTLKISSITSMQGNTCTKLHPVNTSMLLDHAGSPTCLRAVARAAAATVLVFQTRKYTLSVLVIR